MPASKLTRALLVAATAAAISVTSATAALADPTDAEELFRQGERDFINQPAQSTPNAGDLFRQGEVDFINQSQPAPAPDSTRRHRLNGLTVAVAAALVLLGAVTAAAAWWLTGRRLRPRQVT